MNINEVGWYRHSGARSGDDRYMSNALKAFSGKINSGTTHRNGYNRANLRRRDSTIVSRHNYFPDPARFGFEHDLPSPGLAEVTLCATLHRNAINHRPK